MAGTAACVQAEVAAYRNAIGRLGETDSQSAARIRVASEANPNHKRSTKLIQTISQGGNLEHSSGRVPRASSCREEKPKNRTLSDVTGTETMSVSPWKMTPKSVPRFRRVLV